MADQKDERDLPVELQIFFVSLESKIQFSSHFRVQSTFFRAFSRGVWEGPRVSEISSRNKSGKIDLCEGRTQKSATFDLLNPRPQNPAWEPIFNALESS